MATHDDEELPRSDQAALETPESFLVALSKALKEAEGVDADVADILVSHLLTVTPAKNAVTSAKDAILKLAETRAASARELADS
jgi:anti-sigma factor ChrR (cupin superfamily)